MDWIARIVGVVVAAVTLPMLWKIARVELANIAEARRRWRKLRRRP